MAVSPGAGLCREHEKCDGEGAGGAENCRIHRRAEKIYSVGKSRARTACRSVMAFVGERRIALKKRADSERNEIGLPFL